jgi:copper(I)-binding protein
MLDRRLFACALLCLAPASVAAAPHPGGGVEVRQPWSRPSAGTTAAGYMVLVNHAARPDALVKVESPLATRVEAHRSDVAGGVMRMTAEPRVTIPADGKLAFAPGGYHLMFEGLKAPLRPGDRLPATLTFASGQRKSVSFAVGTGAGPPPVAPMGHSVAPADAAAERSHLVTKK